jgi:hypothetical protein
MVELLIFMSKLLNDGGGEQDREQGAGETLILNYIILKMKMFLIKSYLTCSLCSLCSPMNTHKYIYLIISIN